MEDEDNIPTLISVKPLKPEYSHLQKITLASKQFTVGRSIGKSAVIPYLSISRLHCIFNKSENNDWYIQDCSSFGITINNKKLGKGSQVIISDGDIITLEPTAEFVYKFSHMTSDVFEIPKKRIRIENNIDNCILNNVKMKFAESQNYEIKHIEEKIQNAKQLQTTSIILKQQLQADMDRKIQLLESDFAAQIENLNGEKNEVEKQKALLIEERDEQLAQVKNEMAGKIAELMDQIQKHNENESELLKENNLLKDKLDKEREEFLAELSRESTSKKDMLENLEAKIREQEEVRLREKQELEETLRKETEQLRLAQEKELKEIAEQKRLRELELEQELNNIKAKLQEKVEQTEKQKLETEQQLNMKMEQLQKLSDEEKIKVEQLQKEREEIQYQLLEAQRNAETSLAELEQRKTELATLAAARVQAADQSNKVITLQEQLEKMKNAVQSLESEKTTLLSIYVDGAGEGTSKQNLLQETELESELMCSICSEVFIEPMTLNCAHSFCKYCINMWKKKKKDCPICRTPITADNRSLVLDKIIEKSQSLTEEMKLRRQDILKTRAEEVLATSRKPRATTSSSRTRGTTRTPRGRARARGRGITITIADGAGGMTTSIPTVDLTGLPIPMSPAEWPPVVAPLVSLARVLQPARAPPSHRAPAPRPHQLWAPPPPPLRHPEIPLVVAETVDVETSPASQGPTSAGTGAATDAARAATGRPAAPSGSARPPAHTNLN